MSEIWCCYKVNIMMDRFSSCQCGNNCKQTRKWKQKSPQCSIFSIKNKWIPESDWMSVNTLKIQSFLICKILIKLRMISIVLLHSYKESNKKTAFLKGGGILDLFYLYCKIPDILGHWWSFGSISLVLQNYWKFLMVEEFWIYFFVLQNFRHFQRDEEFCMILNDTDSNIIMNCLTTFIYRSDKIINHLSLKNFSVDFRFGWIL